ncbi:MAG: hypothetical protein QOC96_143 [Acidobacteriota bacterium]|nr:hypothetical protein [Acidobacteriota bacterium]
MSDQASRACDEAPPLTVKPLQSHGLSFSNGYQSLTIFSDKGFRVVLRCLAQPHLRGQGQASSMSLCQDRQTNAVKACFLRGTVTHIGHPRVIRMSVLRQHYRKPSNDAINQGSLISCQRFREHAPEGLKRRFELIQTPHKGLITR